MTSELYTTDQAVRKLIEIRQLTPQIVRGLGLNQAAVRNWQDLPAETQESMVNALIDRFCDD